MSYDLERIAVDRADFEARHVERGIPTRLYRSRNGETIHTPGCKYACSPWFFAEDHTDAEIASVPWLNPCGHCKPYVKSPGNPGGRP